MKQTGNSAQAARAEMDHAQAELMEIPVSYTHLTLPTNSRV